VERGRALERREVAGLERHVDARRAAPRERRAGELGEARPLVELDAEARECERLERAGDPRAVERVQPARIAARRRAAELRALDERDRRTRAGEEVGGEGPGDAPADDDDVPETRTTHDGAGCAGGRAGSSAFPRPPLRSTRDAPRR
jgi:hypothetical protein